LFAVQPAAHEVGEPRILAQALPELPGARVIEGVEPRFKNGYSAFQLEHLQRER
jgi:hypothetical protein